MPRVREGIAAIPHSSAADSARCPVAGPSGPMTSLPWSRMLYTFERGEGNDIRPS
jgi:hypothetical protein